MGFGKLTVMKIRKLHPDEWIPKLYDFLEKLFDEEDEEELDPGSDETGGRSETGGPERQRPNPTENIPGHGSCFNFWT